MSESLIKVPQGGQKIIPGQAIPDNPIIPFIEGDGIGVDITPVMIKVVDAAVAKAYGGKKKIHWMEVYAGEKSTKMYGSDVWMSTETLDALKEYSVSIKGPMTTPVGGGIRSLNVALRQELDLYQCVRPVQYFKGVPSPLKNPEKTNMVIFRENTEDIYAGVEWMAGTDACKKIIKFLVAKNSGICQRLKTKNLIFLIIMLVISEVYSSPVKSQPLKENQAVDEKVRKFLAENPQQWQDMNVPSVDGQLLHEHAV